MGKRRGPSGGGGRGMSVRRDSGSGCSKGGRGGEGVACIGGRGAAEREEEDVGTEAAVEDDCCIALACQWCSEECRK